MMHKLTFVSGLVLLLTTTISAQKLIDSVDTKEKYSIPFYLTEYNNIVISGVLNNQDTVNLMFHTASSDVTLTEEAFARLKAVQLDGTVDGVKSWGGGTNSSDFSKDNSLDIAGMSWRDITIWQDKNSGQKTDGKFGPNLFDGRVIEIDFDKHEIVIGKMMPRKARKYEKFQLLSNSTGMFIEGSCQIGDDSFKNKFLIHTGYGGDILLDDHFVNESKIGQRINITGEKRLKDAYGNIVITKKGIVPQFKIGKLQMAKVPIGFFEGTIGRQKMSIIGGDLLKRFNWIIDAEREFIYLKPNDLFSSKIFDS